MNTPNLMSQTICRPWLPENLQGGPRCSYSNSHSRLPQVAPDRRRSPLRRRVAVLQKEEGLWGHWHLGLSALRRWTIFLMASVLRPKRIGKALHDDSSPSVDPTRGRMTRGPRGSRNGMEGPMMDDARFEIDALADGCWVATRHLRARVGEAVRGDRRGGGHRPRCASGDDLRDPRAERCRQDDPDADARDAHTTRCWLG